MIIDNIGWNVDAVRDMTKKQFISDPQHHALYWRITDPDERKKALTNAYNLIVGSRPEPIQEETEQE
jgi:hypothetical protein